MIKNRLFQRFLALFCIILVLVPGYKTSAAEKPKVEIEDGILTFVTKDTKASTNITWKTIGFNICRVPTNGDPTKTKHATLYLSQGEKKEKIIDSKTVEVTFTISEEVINQAFEDAGLHTIIKDGDEIYLNGIFKVMHGTTELTKEYHKLYGKTDGISEAELWNDKSDFEDRFDLKVIYKENKQTYPINIEYWSYTTNETKLMDTKNFTEQKNFTTFTTNSKNIPNEKNGYQLYRIYYINLSNSKKKLGNRKTSINPNFFKNEYLSELSYVRDRDFTVKKGGIKIVAMYRKFSNKTSSENSEELEREFEEIDPTAVIAADTRGNEQYDVSEGIPGTETLYTNVISSKYLSSYKFVRKYGKKLYPVKVIQNVTLVYDEEEEQLDEKTGEIITVIVPKTESKDVIKTYQIEREYSYWQIENLGVYGIDKAEIKTDALSKTATMLPTGYSLPTVTYKQNTDEKSHLIEPKIKDVVLSPITVESNTYPSPEWKENAEKSVDKIICKNDNLIFNGEVIMSDEKKEEKTDNPKEIMDGLEEVGENVLYKSNLEIPSSKANKEYETTGTITYKPVVEINIKAPKLTYEIEDINSVTVHTPVVCDAMIQDNYKDNQMINPTYGMASLILDRPFYVTLPTTGSHRYIQGYGYRDYAKYITSREVKFPFDVYRGSSADGSFISKNTWTSISDDTQFYLPTWVKEGQYTIDFRSTSINASANNATSKIESLANLSLENYVATDTTTVEVSGRVYGFNLYDVTDYPTWEEIFRLYAGTTKLSGFTYPVGIKDQNGNITSQDSKYTLAMINGVHPKYKNLGAIKTGYATRFSLKTIGSMNNDKDYIRIIPTFYYVDSKGQNRQEVDIYYSETFNGKKNHMVKMGGALDLENKKSITTGDLYLSINEKELYQTAILKGITLKEIKAQTRKVFTYTNIMIPESLRTFVGYVKTVPGTVSKDTIAKSVQNWYGEYFFPSEVHVVPKDFDVLEYTKHNGSLNYKESFWLKNGYIIVNFQIETIKDGKRHLSYINTENALKGYCNMWNREGFQYEKVDYYGNKFTFQDGDYILYHTDKSASQDWITSGTH